jgi:flagellar biosynthetic protein FliR
MLAAAVLGLRAAAAIAVLTTLVGGVPRMVQAGLVATFGVWTGLMLGGAGMGALPATTGDLVAVAVSEVAIGAALGVMAAVPLVAAQMAGRLVDIAASARAQGPYGALFGVLAAAVFVGVDGHVMVVASIVESHARVPAIGVVQPGVMHALGALVPAAVRLAVPWLVTAVVVQVAVGAGVRVAGRSGAHVGGAAGAAVPAAMVMMTATLVSLLTVGISTAIRDVL